MEKGQIVYSKAGRDKQEIFIIFDILDDFVFLVNGKSRKIDKPKKKKIKHIQKTNYISQIIKEKIKDNLLILDSDLRKEILNYQKKEI
jgi:ribosomal protein L14E/L6E/L27E